MIDDLTIDFYVTDGVLEIDANIVAAIIANTCHPSEANAAKAANLIVRYLLDAIKEASERRRQ